MIKINESTDGVVVLNKVCNFLLRQGYVENTRNNISAFVKKYSIDHRVKKKIFMGVIIEWIELKHIITFYSRNDMFDCVLIFDLGGTPADKGSIFTTTEILTANKDYNKILSVGLDLINYRDRPKPTVGNYNLVSVSRLAARDTEAERYVYQTITKDIPNAVNYFHKVLKPDLRKGRM